MSKGRILRALDEFVNVNINPNRIPHTIPNNRFRGNIVFHEDMPIVQNGSLNHSRGFGIKTLCHILLYGADYIINHKTLLGVCEH